MSKINYTVKENKFIGTHSFYAVPIPHGSLTFDELCREACDGRSIEPSIMKACVEEYMKVVQRNVLKGFRCPVGEQFLFIYPNIRASVKDEMNQDGTLKKAATADMVSARKAESRLGCSVSRSFSADFAKSVNWQRVDAAGKNEAEPDDVTDDENAQTGNGDNGGSTPDPNAGND